MSKSKTCEIVKVALFEILIRPKLISRKNLSDRKIANYVHTFFKTKPIRNVHMLEALYKVAFYI